MPITNNNLVTISVNREAVSAEFIEWSSEHPGYAVVRHNGRKLIRRLRDGLVPQVSETQVQVDTVEDETEFNINERFSFMTQMVELVISGNSNGLIITGSGGLGKSHTVMEALADNDLGEADFHTIKGYSTAKSLYQTMYEHNGKVIVFDDCDSVLEDKTAVNLLKAALDSNGRRTVSWMTSRESEDLPNQFDFEGRIIFISNKELSQIPQPLLSRSLFVDVTMTTDEKIERIAAILPRLKNGMPEEQKREVLSLIKRHKDRIEDLNIRTFLKIADIREGHAHGWERLATYVLTRKIGGR